MGHHDPHARHVRRPDSGLLTVSAPSGPGVHRDSFEDTSSPEELVAWVLRDDGGDLIGDCLAAIGHDEIALIGVGLSEESPTPPDDSLLLETDAPTCLAIELGTDSIDLGHVTSTRRSVAVPSSNRDSMSRGEVHEREAERSGSRSRLSWAGPSPNSSRRPRLRCWCVTHRRSRP